MLPNHHLRFRVDLIRTCPAPKVSFLFWWQRKNSIFIRERYRIFETFTQVHTHEWNIFLPVDVGCLEQNSLLFFCVGLLASCDLQMCTAAPVQLRSNWSWRYATILIITKCMCRSTTLNGVEFLNTNVPSTTQRIPHTLLNIKIHYFVTTVCQCIFCWARLVQSTPVHPTSSKSI